MATYNPAGGKTYTLGNSISSTATTILLSSFVEPVSGVPYTMVLLNTDIAYGTIGPKTTSSEFISFTGITQNANGTATLTGVTRGLAKKYPFTTSATFKLPHSGQTPFILSDMPQVFQKYVPLVNDVTVDGVKTFSSSPIVPTPTTDFQAATKKYVDDIAIAGAPDASTTIKGIGKVSVAPVSPTEPIFVGDNDTRVPTQTENNAMVGNNTDVAVGTGNTYVTQTGLQHNAEKYAADAGANDTYVITLSPAPTSYTNGMVVYFKANTANTGAATINVNGLGAKTIVKYVNTTLADNDIAAGMFCTLIYDGTNFVLQNPISNVVAPQTPSFQLISTVTMSAVAIANGTITKIAEFTGLTGNTADVYMLEFEGVTSSNVGSAAYLALRLNDGAGAGTYATKNIYQNNVTVGTIAGTATELRLIGATANNSVTCTFGNLEIKAARTIAGTTRLVIGNFMGIETGVSTMAHERVAGTWADVTNELTSIQFYFYQNDGSYTMSGKVSLYKINRS